MRKYTIYDRWTMRYAHKGLLDAISRLPQGSYPSQVTKADIAHIVGTMSHREISMMLKAPGLDAALSEVFDTPSGHGHAAAAVHAHDLTGRDDSRPPAKKFVL